MKKLLLSVVLVGSLSCSAIFAQPAMGVGFPSLFTHKAAGNSKNSQSQCPLEVIGNTLKTLMALKLKPGVFLETSDSASDYLHNLNKNSCPNAQIIVGLDSHGMSEVSGPHFTSYICYSKNGGILMCYVPTSNYQVA